MSGSISIVIADNHAIFRSAVRKLLDREPGMQVVGEASNTTEAVQQVQKLRPDILLLDAGMPEQSPLEALRRIAASQERVRPILLTTQIERDEILQALQLGARGVMPKSAETRLLFKSIRTVMAGEVWIARECIADIVAALRSVSPILEPSVFSGYDLTQREIDIISAVVDGCTNKDIAEKFSLSQDTVKHHLTRIFAKLGVPNRLELALFAINHHLIREP